MMRIVLGLLLVIFILRVEMYQAETSYIGGPPMYFEFVSSPQEASIYLWNKNNGTDIWTFYIGELWEVDLKKGAAQKMPIPEIFFKQKED